MGVKGATAPLAVWPQATYPTRQGWALLSQDTLGGMEIVLLVIALVFALSGIVSLAQGALVAGIVLILIGAAIGCVSRLAPSPRKNI